MSSATLENAAESGERRVLSLVPLLYAEYSLKLKNIHLNYIIPTRKSLTYL